MDVAGPFQPCAGVWSLKMVNPCVCRMEVELCFVSEARVLE